MTDALVDLAGTRMGRRLTSPLARGADVHQLVLKAAGDPATAEVDRAKLSAYLADHLARFGRPAQPSYVLRALRDLDQATTVSVVSDAPGADPIKLQLPAGTLAGQSFALALPADATPRSLTAVPRVPNVTAAKAWSVTALLGTTAKLLWALGWERDNVRRQAARTAEQRRLGSAIRASLDRIGADLGVPRFPPLPYGFDRHTVALYHGDDIPSSDPDVADFTASFPGRAAHHGTLAGGATPGAPGRFNTAIAMTDDASAVRVASSTDFAVPADGELTVECFVRPAADTGPGRVLRAGAATGWSIELGDFGRGLPRTVRARISDGTVELEVFGDTSLPFDGFTHVAAVLTRREGGAAALALWLDGRRAATADADAFGRLAGARALVIGPNGTGFRGVIDEIRISDVARGDFFPALGEADKHYRRRLALFRGWVLPTPARLQELLNKIVGKIGGVSEPLVVDDGDGELVRGTALMRVVPASIMAGETMDAVGRRGVSEADLYDPDADPTVDPALLGRHNRDGVVYTEPPPRDLLPGEPPPDPHLMQSAVSAALDKLVDLTRPAAAGPLTVDLAFDPRVPGPHATGRAVLVRRLGFDPARLAALAHRSGFDFVRHVPLTGAVYCSCAPGRLVSLVVTPANANAEPVVGQPARVRVVPKPPVDAEVTFRTVGLGPGRAFVTANAAARATLRGKAAGHVAVIVDITRGGRTVSASTTVAIRPATVADGASIAADGTLGVTEEVVGPPEPTFDPALLVSIQDPRISVDAGVDSRVQRGVARRLTALLARLGIDTAGTLTVVSAFVPATGNPTLAGRGRALTIRHSTVEPGPLAAAAHAVGFGFVAHSGQTLLLRHPAEQLIEVIGPTELEEGATAAFHVEPDPATLPPTMRLGWSSGGLVEGSIGVTTTIQPAVSVRAQRSGKVWLQAALHEVDALTTYQVEVRLRPELVTAGATVSRDQYDLIMNVLHALHPIGVEIITRRLREAVVELRGASIDADPRYTYPQFRLHHERH